MKLISYYIDKQNRLFEITKEHDGLIHVRLLAPNDVPPKLVISPDDCLIDIDILEIP